MKAATEQFSFLDTAQVTDLVKATWEDGHTWMVVGLTIQEYLGTLLAEKTRHLPPKSRNKCSRGTVVDVVCHGTSSDHGDMRLVRRKSRGLQLSLFAGSEGKQVCQLKMDGLTTKAGDRSGTELKKEAITVMKTLSEELLNSATEFCRRYERRDEVMLEHDLVQQQRKRGGAAPVKAEPIAVVVVYFLFFKLMCTLC